MLRRTKLSRAFNGIYTLLCAVFCSGWAKCAMCAKVEAAIAQTLKFVLHFKWPLAGGLRAGAHLIVGQNMAYNVRLFAVAGIGGFKNGAQRNVKADPL